MVYGIHRRGGQRGGKSAAAREEAGIESGGTEREEKFVVYQRVPAGVVGE